MPKETKMKCPQCSEEWTETRRYKVDDCPLCIQQIFIIIMARSNIGFEHVERGGGNVR